MNERQQLEQRFDALKGANLTLDLTRGKPAAAQLDLANDLDGFLQGDFTAADGTDVRNYGGLRGIAEARALGARFLDVQPDQVIAGGNSSLTLMFYVLDAAMNAAAAGPPWRNAAPVKALCPVPGYDRHFALAEALGMELVAVPMTDQGPDMDVVEELVARDRHVRCIWCVPKYANPTGCIYSPDTVRRLAELPGKAELPFLVLWDNAYAVHDFVFPPQPLTSILPLAEAAGTEDGLALFASTSKVTFASGGIAFLGGSAQFLDAIEKRLSIFMIGADKVNQLRHARFLGARLDDHMRAHAEQVRPKFDAVQRGLESGLVGTGLARWTRPAGGYFVSLDTRPGLASQAVALAGELGVALTPAGATFPYGRDPNDSNIRIAPSFATLAEVEVSIDVLALCIRLAAARQADSA